MVPARVWAAGQSRVGSLASVLVRRPRWAAGAAPRRHAAPGPHPFNPAGGQQSPRSVRVFIADAALRYVGKGGDAGMWMEPETGKRIWFSLSVEEVEEYEGFQKTAKVRGRHQACDRPLAL